MTETQALCQKQVNLWERRYNRTITADCLLAWQSWKAPATKKMKEGCAGWLNYVSPQHQAQHSIQAGWQLYSRPAPSELECLFREHAQRWKVETRHWSSITKMIAHPSYLRIIGLAGYSTDREIERLLLRELQEEPDHWFAALTAITGEDPVQPQHDFDEAVAVWLEWGQQKGII